MPIVRFSPMHDLINLQERMNRILGDLVPGATRGEEFLTGTWVPKVDIYETEGSIVVKADIPEIDRKDVKIKVEENVLTLSGERRMDKEVKEESYHRIERSYGSFSRSFTLPGTVDQEKITATFKDGVLKIDLPKKVESTPKEVKIEIG